jgi:hypothetical protein
MSSFTKHFAALGTLGLLLTGCAPLLTNQPSSGYPLVTDSTYYGTGLQTYSHDLAVARADKALNRYTKAVKRATRSLQQSPGVRRGSRYRYSPRPALRWPGARSPHARHRSYVPRVRHRR